MRYNGLIPFEHLPLESSISAALQCDLPASLLSDAIWLYFMGFFTYLLCCWRYQVEKDDQNASRNVFIFFAAFIGLYALQMTSTETMRDIDHARRLKHYAGSNTDDYLICAVKEERLKKLRTQLGISDSLYGTPVV
jgi:hypothetical protein